MRQQQISASHAFRRNALVIAVVLVLSAAAILLVAAAPAASAVPSTFLVGPVVLGCLLIWRNARPSTTVPISPLNIAHTLFAIQLVIPIVANWSGYAYGQLLRLPAERSINIALLVQLFAYVVFCASYHAAARKHDRDIPGDFAQSRRALRLGLAPVYLAIGVVGAFSTFGSLQAYAQYFSNPDTQADVASALSHTLGGAAGTFLRPFLGVAIVLVWSLYVEHRNQIRLSGLRVRVATLVAAVVLLLSSASYNRGSMVAPLIALMGAYSLHVRRLRPVLLLFVAIAGTAAVLLWGEYRSSRGVTLLDLLNIDSVHGLYRDSTPGDELQVYGQGPQFLGFFLERIGFGSELWYGRATLTSLIYPVPILGSYFRADSAVTFYNNLIYNSAISMDQIVPFAGELFLDFHLIGVVIGYGLLGWAVSAFQLRFLRSPNAFEAYLWCLVGMWTSFLVIGNLAILSQIYIYFFWPFYLYGIAALWSGARWNHLAHHDGIREAS